MQTFQQRGEVKYCAVGIHYNDRPDTAQLLAHEGRILLFSTLAEAQSALPRFGGADRHTHWSADEEEAYWTPLDMRPGSFNKAVILTGYDPYNVPANGIPGIRSETRGRDWRHHMLFNNVIAGVTTWLDTLEAARRADIG